MSSNAQTAATVIAILLPFFGAVLLTQIAVMMIRARIKRRRAEHGSDPRDVQSFGSCPRCGSILEKRIDKFGAYLGCTNNPDCHFTRIFGPESQA